MCEKKGRKPQCSKWKGGGGELIMTLEGAIAEISSLGRRRRKDEEKK